MPWQASRCNGIGADALSERLDMLRLLEPLVRPDRRDGGTGAPAVPLEHGSFEQLLEQARAGPEANPALDASAEMSAAAPHGAADDAVDAAPQDDPQGTRTPAPLAELARFERIENPTLRMMLQRGDASAD